MSSHSQISANDSQISAKVRAALERDSRIPHPAEIAVSAKNGTVTLRGTVSSFRQRHAAIEIAKTVTGGGVVEEELIVDPRDHWEDNELRGAAFQALIANADVPADRIDVQVKNRWLTLKGEVEHQYDSDAAFDTVSGLPGVGGITNEIRVVTAGVDG